MPEGPMPELGQLPLEPLPEGWKPVAVVALIKCEGPNGRDLWAYRTSDDLSDEEAMGALVIRTDLYRASVMESIRDFNDETQDEPSE